MDFALDVIKVFTREADKADAKPRRSENSCLYLTENSHLSPGLNDDRKMCLMTLS